MPKPAMLIPREIARNKPPHGSPCNRCGVCCMVTICPLGQHIFGLPAAAGRPCPALREGEEGFYCGVAADPAAFTTKARAMRFGVERLRQAARLLIGASDGCDARFNGEPRNMLFAEALERKVQSRARDERKAARMWGGGAHDDCL